MSRGRHRDAGSGAVFVDDSGRRFLLSRLALGVGAVAGLAAVGFVVVSLIGGVPLPGLTHPVHLPSGEQAHAVGVPLTAVPPVRSTADPRSTMSVAPGSRAPDGYSPPTQTSGAASAAGTGAGAGTDTAGDAPLPNTAAVSVAGQSGLVPVGQTSSDRASTSGMTPPSSTPAPPGATPPATTSAPSTAATSSGPGQRPSVPPGQTRTSPTATSAPGQRPSTPPGQTREHPKPTHTPPPHGTAGATPSGLPA